MEINNNVPHNPGLSTIRAVLNSENELAKPNRFITRITPTAINTSVISQYFSNEDRNYISNWMHFFCEEAELPSRTLITSEVVMGGLATRNPYMTSYEPITLQFICSNKFRVKEIFDNWMNAIQPIHNYDLNFKEDYQATIEFFQFDEADNAIYFKKLEKAYPVFVSPIPLGWGRNNQYSKVVVKFVYDRWYRYDTDIKAPTTTTATSGVQGATNNNAPYSFGLNEINIVT